MKKITRRSFLKATATGAALATAAACGMPSTDTSSTAASTSTSTAASSEATEGEEVVLRIVDWSDSSIPYREPFHAKFEENHPGVKIEYSAMKMNDFMTSVMTSLKSGDAPDLFPVPNSMNIQMAIAEDMIQPLEPLVGKEFFANMNPDVFVEGFTMQDGVIWGMPEWDAAIQTVIYYNKDILAEAGVDTIPETYSEFREACRKISEIGNYGLIDGGVQIPRIDMMARGFTWTAGGCLNTSTKVVSQNGETGYNSPEALEAFQFLQELYEDGYVHPDFVNIDAVTARDMFAKGQGAFLMQGIWCVGAWSTTDPDFNYGTMPVPVPDGFDRNMGGIAKDLPALGGLQINKNTTKTDLAVEYIKCLYSEEYGYQAANVEAGIGISIIPEINDKYLVSEQMKGYYDISAKYGRIVPESSRVDFATLDIYGEVVSIAPSFGDILQGVLSGGVTDYESYLNKLNDDTVAEWKRAAEAVGVDYNSFVFPNWSMDKNYTDEDYAAL